MLAPNGIKGIFFDLDGTLRFNVPAGRDFLADRLLSLGVQVTREDRARAWRWEHQYWAESDDLHGDLAAYPEESAFWLNYCRRQSAAFGCSPEQSDGFAAGLQKYMNVHYKPESRLEPNATAVLEELSRAGYILGVISNRGEPFDDELERQGIRGLFQLAVSSSEAGVRKPDPEIFHYTLRQAGLEPSQVIYVGDNYYADVIGARNARILPVLLDQGRIFDDPGCAVIASIEELPAVLEAIREK